MWIFELIFDYFINSRNSIKVAFIALMIFLLYIAVDLYILNPR